MLHNVQEKWTTRGTWRDQSYLQGSCHCWQLLHFEQSPHDYFDNRNVIHLRHKVRNVLNLDFVTSLQLNWMIWKLFTYSSKNLPFQRSFISDKLAFWIRLITLGLWGQTSSALFGPKPSSSSMSFCVVVTRSLLRNRLVNRFKHGQKVAMNTSYTIEINITLIM